MKSNIEHKIYSGDDQFRLFKSFAESMKLPLMQIARSAEFSYESGDVKSLQNLAIAADTLENMIDNYLLSLQLQAEGDQLVLSPISLGAALDDVAHALDKKARKYSCDIELTIAGKYGPVLAHPAGLRAALVSIGTVLIDAQNQQQKPKRQVIILAAHRTRYGIVAGMFSDVAGIDTKTFNNSKNLYGNAPQPLAQLTSASGAEIYIANSLLSTMTSGLRSARFQKLNGLAATFTPSQQLSLV